MTQQSSTKHSSPCSKQATAPWPALLNHAGGAPPKHHRYLPFIMPQERLPIRLAVSARATASQNS
eukprot:2171739-Karenia_brevis.AAC.1